MTGSRRPLSIVRRHCLRRAYLGVHDLPAAELITCVNLDLILQAIVTGPPSRRRLLPHLRRPDPHVRRDADHQFRARRIPHDRHVRRLLFLPGFHTEAYTRSLSSCPRCSFSELSYSIFWCDRSSAPSRSIRCSCSSGFRSFCRTVHWRCFSADTRSVQSAIAYSKIELGEVIVGIPRLIAFAVSVIITLAALLAIALNRAWPPYPRGRVRSRDGRAHGHQRQPGESARVRHRRRLSRHCRTR